MEPKVIINDVRIFDFCTELWVVSKIVRKYLNHNYFPTENFNSSFF